MLGSLYFRIGFSFVVFLVAVIVAQSAIFSYILARSGNRPIRPPNNLAAIIAADIGSTLAQDQTIDLQAYLTREYADVQPVYLVMKDGRVTGNRSAPLADSHRWMAEAVLAADGRLRAAAEPPLGGTPVVTAPIQVDGELRGLVVLPPLPPQNPVARDVSRLLSVPGTLLLIVATVIAAGVIFEPARRRLKALESATARFGAGDLAARAPESGNDEIGRVAAEFKDLLDLARLESGVAPLDVRLFDVRRVFEHVAARHEQETNARRIAIDVRVAGEADQVTADPDRIEQVIENLFANALRHTPDGGTIVLSSAGTDDRIELSVVDAGAGIPIEHVPHVFDRFYKVDSSRAQGSGGSGLGLSITKAIVDRHGGQIRLTSEPGRTAFTIALPASHA